MNNIPIKKRLIELLIDYFVIIAYLVMLLIINLSINFIIFKGFPVYTEFQAQMIAGLTAVIPIILIFSYLDYYTKGTIGKRVSGLKMTYANYRFHSSLLRNIIKFLPWQLGHLGVIHGVYNDFDMAAVIIANSGMFLGIVMLCMGLFRKDKCHLGDLIAGTKVELQ